MEGVQLCRRFVLVGARALASGDYRLDDLAGTSGRFDALLRGVRTGLLVSHGVRRDTAVYLVLLGGERAPRCLRIRGLTAKFLRPDERSLAVLAQKALRAPATGEGFVPVRPGIDVCAGGLAAALDDAGPGPLFALDAAGDDLRDPTLPLDLGGVFVVGDSRGFDASTWAQLDARGARRLSLGPVQVHGEDALTLVHNELDRRAARAQPL